MIKQALLFVVSTGVLVYFVTPVADDQQSQPEAQEPSKPKPATQPTVPEYWGDEEDDDDDDAENTEEEFVFGQPVIYSEDEEEDDYQPVPPASSGATNQRSSVRRAASSDSGNSGRLGSRENPIDLTPPGGRQRS